jgi:hypothetical protein
MEAVVGGRPADRPSGVLIWLAISALAVRGEDGLLSASAVNVAERWAAAVGLRGDVREPGEVPVVGKMGIGQVSVGGC